MKARIEAKCILLAAVVLAAGAPAAALSVTYTQVVDLGTLGGAYSVATGVNDAGQVVGFSTYDTHAIAFLWDSANGMVSLGTLGGPTSYANAINNAGQVVGYSSDGSSQQAFVWDAVNGMTCWISYRPSTSSLHAINDSGWLAGELTGRGDTEAVTEEDGDYSSLWPGVAYGNNDAGDVVGFHRSYNRAVLSRNGVITDLGALDGGTESCAYDINNAGQVVGYSRRSTRIEAFIWDPATGMAGLGTLGGTYSYANAINDSGLVVGYGNSRAGMEAFLWEEGTGLVSLNGLTGVAGMENWRLLAQATAVNSAGDIVGRGLTTDGEIHAFLLLTGTVVPEPASVTLLGIGLAGLVCRGMRRKLRG